MGISAFVRFSAIVIFGTAGLLFGPSPASADKRVALVIGNGAYQRVSKLSNPTNDAMAIAGMLKAAGFDEVALHQNLGIRELRKAIGDFSDLARDADTAVVYYSGHGIEVNGINYLIPIDAILDRDIDVAYETYSLDNLVQVLEPARRLRLVMLDACRDNPFTRSMKRTVGTRAVGRGLAAVEPTSLNTVIGFAAKAGSFALDGEGANSPYATALLNNLATPGLDLRIAFGRVRDEVLKATKNKQEPFVYGSLGGAEVSIVAATSAAPIANPTPPLSPAPPVASNDAAERAWMVAKDTTSQAVLEEFIRHFGNSFYAALARARLEELRKNQVSSAPQPAPITARPSTAPPSPNPVELAWNSIQNSTSISEVEEFIRQYGSTVYGSMARARLDELKKIQEKNQIAAVPPQHAAVEPPKADRCSTAVGTWTITVFRTATVTFNANRTATNSNIGTGTWSCSNGQYSVTWQGGLTDHFAVSSDGTSLSGTGAIGLPLSGTRIGRANAR